LLRVVANVGDELGQVVHQFRPWRHRVLKNFDQEFNILSTHRASLPWIRRCPSVVVDEEDAVVVPTGEATGVSAVADVFVNSFSLTDEALGDKLIVEDVGFGSLFFQGIFFIIEVFIVAQIQWFPVRFRFEILIVVFK
jgi:hypothetical protein